MILVIVTRKVPEFQKTWRTLFLKNQTNILLHFLPYPAVLNSTIHTFKFITPRVGGEIASLLDDLARKTIRKTVLYVRRGSRTLTTSNFGHCENVILPERFPENTSRTLSTHAIQTVLGTKK